MSGAESKRRQITVNVSEQLVALIDRLKGEYGVRSRGRVLEMVLEDLIESPQSELELVSPSASEDLGESTEVSSLVLIGVGSPADAGEAEAEGQNAEQPPVPQGIDLPGFVRRRTGQLRETLSNSGQASSSQQDPVVSTVSHKDLLAASDAADQHWLSLYGQPPGETVVEASMLWLARDVWSSTDASDGRPFVWSAANAAVKDLCTEWSTSEPTLGRVMVVAGTLEDPFATAGLAERMPTLIRRFVNRFRRSRQVTSFETLESTMTIHGALRLLGLSTQAGASVTLSSIRDAYKNRALEEHPDAGGSTESMRRLNEAYRLLRELYRNRQSVVSD